jgi:flagellar FliL protein
MKMIIMVVAAIAILGGGGAGAYFYFMKPAEASEGDTATKDVKKDDHAKEEKHAKNDAHAEHVEFVELDALILPIIDEEGVNQTVSMVIAIEVGNPEAAKKVESMAPRLKDAYIQELYGVLNKNAALKDGVIQVGMIKERLNTISTKVMGEDVVSDVLLQVVQQTPI